MKKLLSYTIKSKANYVTRSGKKNRKRNIPKLSDHQPFFELQKLPLKETLKIYEDMSNLVENSETKYLTTEDSLKKNFFILPFQSIITPQSSFSHLYKNFTAPKNYIPNLQQFNEKNSKIIDKRALYSVFIHNSCVDGEKKNTTDIGHKVC